MGGFVGITGRIPGGPACSLCLCAQLPSCPRSQTLTQPVSRWQRAPHLSPRLPIFFLQSVPRARSTFQKLLGVVTSQGRSFGVHRLLLGPPPPLSHWESRFALGRLLVGSEGLWLRLFVSARNRLPVSVPLLTARPPTVRVPLEPSAPPRAQV